MLNPKALLSLESSVSAAMRSTWLQLAKQYIHDLQPLLEAGHYADAYRVIDGLVLDGVVGNSRSRLEELVVSSFLFGAGNAVGRPSKSAFVADRKPLPVELGLALDQLASMVEINGAATLRDTLRASVAAEEDASKLLALKDAIFKHETVAGASLLTAGRSVIDISANLTTTRLAVFGFLSEAYVRQITTYQVSEVLDSRTCPICRQMHGKTFEVASELSRVTQALSVQDPNDLKVVSPWPNSSKEGVSRLEAMTTAEMQVAGYGSPPYHPLCRGILVMKGTVTDIVPVLTPIRSPYDTAPASSPATSVSDGVTSLLPTEAAMLVALIDQIQSQTEREAALQAVARGDYDAARKILVRNGIV